jgi:hypothetical protein
MIEQGNEAARKMAEQNMKAIKTLVGLI